jgi:hypothetical protein
MLPDETVSMRPGRAGAEPQARQSRRPSRRDRRRKLLRTMPRWDPRNQCGLTWQFSCAGWPFFLFLLRWALRNSR